MPVSKFETEITVGAEKLTVVVEPDSRLSKTARWSLRGKRLALRVPANMTRGEIDKMLGTIKTRLARQRKRAQKQADLDLTARAEEINRRYFGGELAWHTIRWVKNMQRRLGSCTTGGATDGDIRISERIRQWPAYVVDYVIAHEICHRKYPDHSQAFWEYLARYPFVERARGFIEGIGYAEDADPESLLD